MFADLRITKLLAIAVSILSIAVGIMVLFPQTFFIGNVINAIMILLIMAFSLRVGNIKVALIEIPFLLIPPLLIWLGHPLNKLPEKIGIMA